MTTRLQKLAMLQTMKTSILTLILALACVTQTIAAEDQQTAEIEIARALLQESDTQAALDKCLAEKRGCTTLLIRGSLLCR